MIDRIQYVENIIKQLYKDVPKVFHRQIRNVIYEHYGQIINNFTDNRLKAQKGGKIKKLTQTYKGYQFKIKVEKNKYDIMLTIVTHSDNNRSSNQCAIINIDRSLKLANLSNISYYGDCARPILPKTGGGSIILQFILGFLKENKQNFEINRIVLKDNSIKTCKDCSDNINLSEFYMLLHGNTWYGKYGFRPFNASNSTPNKHLIKLYNKNQNIILNTKVKDLPLMQYIEQAVTKHNLKNVNLKWFQHVLSKWKDKNLSQVLRVIMKNYDQYCCLFLHIQEKLVHKLGLTLFHNNNFYLDV